MSFFLSKKKEKVVQTKEDGCQLWTRNEISVNCIIKLWASTSHKRKDYVLLFCTNSAETTALGKYTLHGRSEKGARPWQKYSIIVTVRGPQLTLSICLGIWLYQTTVHNVSRPCTICSTLLKWKMD